MMGGQPLPSSPQQHQGQQQQQHHNMLNNNYSPQAPPTHASYYAQQQQQQQQQPQTSYYVQQQQQQHQSPSPTATAATSYGSHPNQPMKNSYAARSAAAHHSPHEHHGGSMHHASSSSSQHSGGAIMASNGSVVVESSQHIVNDFANNIDNNGSNPSAKPKSTTTTNNNNNYGYENPQQAAEQTRLLHAATQKVTEYSYHMQRSMENNDVVGTLEQACLLLEELGDPNHGLHHKGGGGGRGGGYGGGNVGGMPGGPPSYYTSAGAVPPLGNYGDRSYPTSLYGGAGGPNDNPAAHAGGGGGIAPLTPKNYYELHMRAMDEMPILEEYLLGLCHVLPTTTTTTSTTAAKNSGGTVDNSGPTNYHHHHHPTRPSSTMNGGGGSSSSRYYDAVGAAQYTTSVLYETVQYCPRVVPRLYLQICMGAVSIRSGSSTPVQVMEELAEAAKCVQCPVRGLFLRYYLLLALKDKLPDGGGLEEDSESKNVDVAKVDESKIEEEKGETIIPPLSHVESGLDILGCVSSGSTSAAMMPTSPPPALPPPPPPATDGPLFPDSTSTDAPLFWDEPLGEDNNMSTTAPVPPVTANTPTKISPADATTTAVSKDNLLPRSTGESTTAERIGTVVDSYEFILRNLLEMNRLWIRIQHMPGDNTKETKRRRERERNDLRILVGSNLNRLSQLDGISALTYGSKILPRILEEIATCRDPLAQAYLMDCIIQVFPAEFHLETLEVFLGVCPRLREKVNVRTIMNNMMDRLVHYFQEEKIGNDEEDTNDVKAMIAMHSFDMFEDCIHRVFEARGLNIPPKDVVRLHGCLLNYALRVAPGHTDLISKCVSHCAKALGTLQEQKRQSMMGQGIVLGGGTKKSMEIDMDTLAITELEKLLSVPLESLGLNVLHWPDFAVLLAFLPWESRGKVAISMVKSITGVIDNGAEGGDANKVKNLDELEQLLIILAPLLRDERSAAPLPAIYDSSDPAAASGGSLISRTANLMGTLGISPSAVEQNYLFGGASIHDSQGLNGLTSRLAQVREEQSSVAKLVHILHHEDTDIKYQMLNVVRRHVQPGGAFRIAVTFPPIVFSALGLLRLVQELEFPEPVAVDTGTIDEEKSPDEEIEEADDEEVDAEETQTIKVSDSAADDTNAIADDDVSGIEADVTEPVDETREVFPKFTKDIK
jgi:hypothetical protein